MTSIRTLFVAIALLSDVGKAQVLPGQIDQFSEQDCELIIDSAQPLPDTKLAWRMTTTDRTLCQGISELRSVVGDEDAKRWSFIISTPKLNPGVVLEADLFYRFATQKTESHYPIRLRTADPFTEVQQLLADAGVALFDPVGQTEKAFEKLSLDANVVPSLKQVSSESIVIIGETIEWDRHLISEANVLIEQGKWLIVLRPSSDSIWPLRLSGERAERLSFLQLAQAEWLPKKFNCLFWSAPLAKKTGWELLVERRELQLIPKISPQVWQLAEYQMEDGNGGCLFVGVPIIARWNDSPLPRELLKAVIEFKLAPSL